MDDLEWVVEAAECFNRFTAPEYVPPSYNGHGGDGERPGDDFIRRADWKDILQGKGWVPVGGNGQKTYWRRPGKTEGWSATTGYCSSARGGDLLYVFTSEATPLEMNRPYSKFSAYGLLYHDGDFKAAAETLKEKGYGPQEPTIQFKATRNGTAEPIPDSVFPSSTENRKQNFQGEGPGVHEGFDKGLMFRRIPASGLQKTDPLQAWLWHGYLTRNGITLLSALWKAGKTTLLAHLFRALEQDGKFCDLSVQASRVLVVTEEHESIWAGRRDLLGLKDHLHFIVRPFAQKPSRDAWVRFLVDLQTSVTARPVDLIVFDTIVNLWPVRDENDASEVQAALMPLRAVAENTALLLVHHLRKNDGKEATGSRGSGAFSAFADILLELRRYNAGDRKDRRRVLAGYGRYEETKNELVVELTEGGKEPNSNVLRVPEYRALGDAKDCSNRDVGAVLDKLLPVSHPGLTYDQIIEAWRLADDLGAPPTKQTLIDALAGGVAAGKYTQPNKGAKGCPKAWYKPEKPT